MSYLNIFSIVSSLYIVISIVIELIDIIFLLTPTDKDDSWGNILLEKWENIGKYVKWFTIKTPVLIFLEYVLNILILIRMKLQNTVIKRRERKSNHISK